MKKLTAQLRAPVSLQQARNELPPPEPPPEPSPVQQETRVLVPAPPPPLPADILQKFGPAPYPIGAWVPDKGYYAGRIAPYFTTAEVLRQKGKPVEKWVRLFLAPHDLFDSQGQRLAIAAEELPRVLPSVNMLGYPARYFSTSQELQKTYKKGQYRGEWFVPSFKMLQTLASIFQKHGFSLPGVADNPDINLQACFYWTCSKFPLFWRILMFAVHHPAHVVKPIQLTRDLTDAEYSHIIFAKHDSRLKFSCRLCRFEP